MLSQCMDKASDLPDSREVEASVEAVPCSVEENGMKDRVEAARVFLRDGQEQIVQGVKVMPSERMLKWDSVRDFPVREHQIDHEVDGWPAYEEEIVSNNTSLQVVRTEPGRPRADSVPSWWRPECIIECVVEVQVPHFREETGR